MFDLSHIIDAFIAHALFEGIERFREWLRNKGVEGNPEVFLKDNLEALRNHPSLRFYVPLNCATDVYIRESSLALEEEINNLLQWGNHTVLLLGDSGSGKSTFCIRLASQLIEEYQKDNQKPLPLLIRLGTSSSAVEHGELIDKELERRFGLSSHDITKLRNEKKFMFILDSYDELGEVGRKSIYTSNKLNEWKAKVIFTCRTQYLEKSEEYIIFSLNPKDPTSLKTLYIVPFSTEQVDSYLQKYAPSDESQWKDWNKYKDKIKETYNLQELATNPLLLRIITETLPSLIKSGGTEGVFTRVKLYQGFFDKWFTEERDRLLLHTFIDKERFFKFAEKVAFEMFLAGKTEIELQEKDPFEENQVQADNPLLKLLTSEETVHSQARSGCPIKRTADNTFEFMHKSFQEFCVARKLCNEINENKLENLNKKLLTAEPAIVQFLSEMVKR